MRPRYLILGLVALAVVGGLAQFILSAAPAGDSGQTAGSLGNLQKNVGIDQKLGEQVPLDLEFRDEQGQTVRLADLARGKPIILSLVYYRCPLLCGEVLNGFLKSSQAVPFVIGQDYDVWTVSFDPTETPELAAQKKKAFVKKYRRPGAEEGWRFLVGDQEEITKLAETVGFRYRYDQPSNQYAHGAGIVMLTPDGHVSHYFYGIEYPPTDLRLALVESGQGRIGSPVDQFLLLCFHYDPATGRYGLAIARLIKTTGLLTLLALGTFWFFMIRRERRMPRLVPLEPETVGGHRG